MIWRAINAPAHNAGFFVADSIESENNSISKNEGFVLEIINLKNKNEKHRKKI